MGRPLLIDETMLQKLEEAFLDGLSDREASLAVDIAPQTLYNYCNEHPDFAERKELLKEQVKLRAKQVVAGAINKNDVHTAQWYLERKAKDEFAPKQEFEHSGDVAIDVTITHEQNTGNAVEAPQKSKPDSALPASV